MNKQVIHQGQTVFFSLSPCSWMYPGYGLQVKLSLTPNGFNGASVFINDKSIQGDRAALEAAAPGAVDKWLSVHGVQPLHDAVAKNATLEAEFALENERNRRRDQVRDQKRIAKLKQQGFTHRIDGWVHPSSGSDRQVSVVTKGTPTDAMIKSALRGCSLKTDYKVSAL